MASVMPCSASSSIRTTRLSSLFLSANKILPSSSVGLKSRSLAPTPTCLAFSPLTEKPNSPFPVGESLKISGWNLRLRHRRSLDHPVVSSAAADADGREIEISDGLGACRLFFYLFLSGVCLDDEKINRENTLN